MRATDFGTISKRERSWENYCRISPNNQPRYQLHLVSVPEAESLAENGRYDEALGRLRQSEPIIEGLLAQLFAALAASSRTSPFGIRFEQRLNWNRWQTRNNLPSIPEECFSHQ
jgi:hypothetical protein